MALIEIAGVKPTREEWRQIEQYLKDAFPPKMVSFRVLRDPYEGEKEAQIAAYIDAEALEDWLDLIVGPENWQFRLTPAASINGIMTAAIGELNIFGITKSNVGDSTASESEPNKRVASDTEKRCAKTWGIFRYAYNLKNMYALVEKKGKNWVMVKGEEDRLRRLLPRPRFVQLPDPDDTPDAAPAPPTAGKSQPNGQRPPNQVSHAHQPQGQPRIIGDGENGAVAAQISSIYAIGQKQGISREAVDELCRETYGVPTVKLTKTQAGVMIQSLQKQKAVYGERDE